MKRGHLLKANPPLVFCLFSLVITYALPVARISYTRTLHTKMAAMTSTFLGSAVAMKASVKVTSKKTVAPVASLDGLKKVRIDWRGDREKPIPRCRGCCRVVRRCRSNCATRISAFA